MRVLSAPSQVNQVQRVPRIVSAKKRQHEEIRKRDVCFKCLTTGHIARSCEQKVECSKCKREHLNILHPDPEAETTLTTERRETATVTVPTKIMSATSTFNNGSSNNTVTSSSANSNGQNVEVDLTGNSTSLLAAAFSRVLLSADHVIRPIVAVTITNLTYGEEEIYTLIDSGADRDFISTELSQRLGLKISVKWTTLHSVNMVTEGWSRNDYQFEKWKLYLRRRGCVSG